MESITYFGQPVFSLHHDTSPLLQHNHLQHTHCHEYLRQCRAMPSKGAVNQYLEKLPSKLVPESLSLVLLGASGEPSISHIHAQAMPPDSDPLCELGRMTEESALYQVDDEIATYSCHIDSILLLGKIDIV
ncbi:uncharacterized protein TrAtP1_005409 [Trichoderma atroviride]|uniref:uncharacterized protein n=1 Tax=Hypocrea atroviridis TaxID=63577 RepID=UPI0033168AF0|nr:hypothetical protein TrAtP1_005409 [Trichoderma atroviride]